MADPARFFVDIPLAEAGEILLPQAVGHHAVRVLRMKSGDEAILFNGQGGEFHGRLVQHEGSRDVGFRVETFDPREAELPFSVCIGQGLCASEKMDWLIEKCVEFGAAHLVPLALERSVVRLTDARAEKRARHWTQLGAAAAEQCGRNRLMTIHPVEGLPRWLEENRRAPLRIVLAPQGELALTTLARDRAPTDVEMLVGPEGGLSPDEMRLATAAGFVAVNLGPRVLRTESAALFALAALDAQWSS